VREQRVEQRLRRRDRGGRRRIARCDLRRVRRARPRRRGGRRRVACRDGDEREALNEDPLGRRRRRNGGAASGGRSGERVPQLSAAVVVGARGAAEKRRGEERARGAPVSVVVEFERCRV